MIAVVVPTIRPDKLAQFKEHWERSFQRNQVNVVCVHDGEDPLCQSTPYGGRAEDIRLSEAPSEWRELVCNYNDGVRNFGFLVALKRWIGKGLTEILTLDDDVSPYLGNDPITEHLEALYSKTDGTPRSVPISWFSSASEYMRGFPYGVRDEAEVWVSHGVWHGCHDYDGPTQLVNGNRPANFYKGAVPKGPLFPLCGMNLAWRVEATPYMYFAPMGKDLGVQRFSDIWMGVFAKTAFDDMKKAIVSGYSTVFHERASNVFNNLEQEAKGIKWNETMWPNSKSTLDEKGEAYFLKYLDLRTKWQKVVNSLLGEREE